MSTGDIGESIVGAYMRYVEKCPIVLYNSFLSDQQGEVDVAAVKPGQPGEPRIVYLCEVTTHTAGMATNTVGRIPDKLARLRQFAKVTFPDEKHRFQWWSPYVPSGAKTEMFDRLRGDWNAEGRSLEFVINRAASRRCSTAHARTRRRPASRPSACSKYSLGSAAKSRRSSEPPATRRPFMPIKPFALQFPANDWTRAAASGRRAYGRQQFVDSVP
jgi:hypothetical protein